MFRIKKHRQSSIAKKYNMSHARILYVVCGERKWKINNRIQFYFYLRITHNRAPISFSKHILPFWYYIVPSLYSAETYYIIMIIIVVHARVGIRFKWYVLYTIQCRVWELVLTKSNLFRLYFIIIISFFFDIIKISIFILIHFDVTLLW